MKTKPIAANQTEVTKNNGNTIFFSYETPVVIKVGKIIYATEWNHSRTTSKHITQCLNRWWKVNERKTKWVTQEELEILAEK